MVMSRCCVCRSQNLVEVVDLPGLPLTGIYITQGSESDYPPIDQALMLCQECGHGQLLHMVDPASIYDDKTYAQRTYASAIAMSGNDFFVEFLNEVTSGRTFKRILEIGCNDLYLLRKIEAKGERLFGVDPIWRGRDHSDGHKITAIGGFVEEIDLPATLEGKPDLILSAHTFEHMPAPQDVLVAIMDAAEDDAVFVIEVPGFDSLLHRCRFDQVFHQHMHYFSLSSFTRMLADCGAAYITHRFHYQMWGGTMLVAFRKGESRQVWQEPTVPYPRPTGDLVKQRCQMFRDGMRHVMQSVHSSSHTPMYGYGAAQMLPVLAYHMGSDLSFLECILDDDHRRANLKYPDLAPPIRQPTPELRIQDATVLITALDSARPILRRAMELEARHILMPVHYC